MITVSAPPPKISGEQYISHSPIKLYTFDDPKIVLKHNNGFSIQHPVKPKDFVAKVLCTNHNHDLHHSEPARLAARACYELIGAAASVFVVPNYTAPPHPPGGAAPSPREWTPQAQATCDTKRTRTPSAARPRLSVSVRISIIITPHLGAHVCCFRRTCSHEV
jgi:hypothetical protein